MIPYDFFKKVEGHMNYIIYGDTDSSYINIPQVKILNNKETYEKANEISLEINQAIKKYMDKVLLPKMGVNPQYNYTQFKTELVATAILFLDIKKNYAYKMIVDEGKILEKPQVKYSNFSVKKSDTPEFTKKFIKEVVEDILFDDNFSYGIAKQKIFKLVQQKRNELIQKIKDYDFFEISTPKKWGLDYKVNPHQVLAMKLYNTLNQKEIFKPMSTCLLLPVKINNFIDFETKIIEIKKSKNDFFIQDEPLIKINKIAIPYNYDKTHLENLFQYYNIGIDIDECWSILLNKTLLRIIELCKTF